MIVAVVVVALILVGGVVGLLVFLNGRLNLSAATVGTCVRVGSDGVAQRRDCADADATSVVLAVEDTSRACVPVPGVTTAIKAGNNVLCLGEKGADAGKAVNGAAVGDCLRAEKDAAERVDCGSGTRKVLEIRRNQLRSTLGSDLGLACATVKGVDAAYAWSLESSQRSPVGTYDLIFCLGPEQR